MADTLVLANARSFLFVPGNRPERFDKALASGADAVVLDLEDSVPSADKPQARRKIAEAWSRLSQQRVPLVIRINAIGDGLAGSEDLQWLAQLEQPFAVMVPKVESMQTLHAVGEMLPNAPLLPLIETAAGYLALRTFASHKQIVRLAVGHIDFMADTDIQCSQDERELDSLRFEVAMVSRGFGLAPAVDGVTVDINDPGRLREDSARALRFGFGGKLCIHPQQVSHIHHMFSPTAQQLDWAHRVLAADAASGGAAVQLDGRMVDVPVVLQARKLLARAGAGMTDLSS